MNQKNLAFISSQKLEEMAQKASAYPQENENVVGLIVPSKTGFFRASSRMFAGLAVAASVAFAVVYVAPETFINGNMDEAENLSPAEQWEEDMEFLSDYEVWEMIEEVEPYA